jgi:hypothetical protein
MNNNISLILPACGDPLISYIWYKNFEKYKSHINNIFVSVDYLHSYNQNINKQDEVTQYLTNFYKNIGINDIIFNNGISEHGKNIRHLLNVFEKKIEKDVLICEEDCFILNKDLFTEKINEYFKYDYDIFGTPLSLHINDKLSKFLNDIIESKNLIITDRPFPDPFSFWPAFYLTKKIHLYKSSMHFEAKSYFKDDHIEILDREYFISENFSLDTFREYFFEVLKNTDIKKILINTKSVSNLYKNFFEWDQIDNFIDFHLNGTSVFSSNLFWIENSYKESAVTKLKALTSINDLSGTFDWYKTVKMYYKMLLKLNPDEFYYYKNYKDNLENLLFVYENEYNIIEQLKNNFYQHDIENYGISDYYSNKIINQIFKM